MDAVTAVALALLALLNACVSAKVLRNDLYTRAQVILQLIVVWTLPVVGAFIVALALRSAKEEPRHHRLPEKTVDHGPENFSQRSAVPDE